MYKKKLKHQSDPNVKIFQCLIQKSLFTGNYPEIFHNMTIKAKTRDKNEKYKIELQTELFYHTFLRNSSKSFLREGNKPFIGAKFQKNNQCWSMADEVFLQ